MKKFAILLAMTASVFLSGCSKESSETAQTQAPAQQPAPAQPAPAAPPRGVAAHPPQGTPGAEAAAPPAAPQHQGKVVKVTHAAGYTYLQLDMSGREVWVASAPVNVKAGDTVAWAGGAVMQNFTSKSLRRTFDEITFVETVSVVN